MQTGYSWDTGLIRKLNEDSIFCTSFELQAEEGALQVGLFAVADGMGGHNAGEVASALAIRRFCSECLLGMLSPGGEEGDLSVIMANAFKKANSAVLEAASDKSLQGMGTTLTAAIVRGQDMFVAHVGDSRCYIINSRETLHITKDHSVVQQMVDYGIITEEEAHVHPRRNEITRVLGYNDETRPDLIHVRLFAGDSILICSDGLCGVLHDDRIAAIVQDTTDIDATCDELIKAANQAGGPDNISVIIIRPDNLPSWQALISAHTSVRAA